MSKLESVFEVSDTVSNQIDTQLARAARLRQSILKAAFEGKLVPQDPADEPASALLDRLRAESASPTPPAARAPRTKRAKASR